MRRDGWIDCVKYRYCIFMCLVKKAKLRMICKPFLFVWQMTLVDAELDIMFRKKFLLTYISTF